MATAQEKRSMMMNAPLGGLIMRLALPSVATMLITSIYNLADTYFVAHISTSATAAVGVTMSLMNIIQAVGFFFGQGTGITLSKALGGGNSELPKKLVSTGVISSFGVGAVMGLAGLLFINPTVWLFGSTATIFPYAKAYMIFILIAAPFMTACFTLNNILRYQGSAYFGMLGMAGGALLNCAMDPILIFVFNLGTAGAGLSTMLSQIVGFFILLWGCGRGGNVGVSLKQFALKKELYAQIGMAGLPSLLRQGCMSVSNIFLNQAAKEFGDVVVAAISVSARASFVINATVIGIGQGFQPVCGFNYGARKYERVRKAFKLTLCITIALLVVFGTACFIFARPIIGIFAKDELGQRLIELGSFCFRAQILTYPCLPVIMVGTMFMQAIDEPFLASFQSFSRQGIFLIPMIFIMSALFGERGIQLCTPVSDCMAFALSAVVVSVAYKRLKRKESVRLVP